ncbi:hypothetical protein LF845_06085 [Deferribacterales bacterium Es71-Z0220]|uniref:hypothetical protein n=1 Tax=Deferrivibrio essentukiensis TaxID=2880922 RepID=UPI001F6168C5|nr:hypothetical protein [Deferrivibrio essentukiensis]MCB4204526.1 hypothetical protein [Deferrivibrio essentukiensis]
MYADVNLIFDIVLEKNKKYKKPTKIELKRYIKKVKAKLNKDYKYLSNKDKKDILIETLRQVYPNLTVHVIQKYI